MKEYEILWRTIWSTVVVVTNVTAYSHGSAVMKLLDASDFKPEQMEIIRVEEA